MFEDEILDRESKPRSRPWRIALGTVQDGESRVGWGILLSSFDSDTGAFGNVKLGAKYGNSATFFCLHPRLPLLYSVGRSGLFPHGSLAVFEIKGSSLRFLLEASSGGSTPCHLAVDQAGTTLAVANYDDGVTSTFSLDELGIPTSKFSTRTVGEGPNKERQDGSHPHGVYFREQILHVPDLGCDKIHCWEIAGPSAERERATLASWRSLPGSGPRHMAFSPDGRHAYVVNELNSTVSALAIDQGNKCFETIHHISTIPEGETMRNTAAEIAIPPNGKFLYASNRGHDSIAIYARDSASGALSRILIAPAGGENPRHFAISPDGRWILCAHQDSDTVAALPLDPESGMIGAPVANISCPKPICVLFIA